MPEPSNDGYDYDPDSETYRCKRCGTHFSLGDSDPDDKKEMHEAICDEVAEANQRAAWARERNPRDPFDQNGLISGGW